MKSKRPWKKYARIERVEDNGGDVTYHTFCKEPGPAEEHHSTVATAMAADKHGQYGRAVHQTKDAAEADLDLWFAAWWPRQVKSRRPA